METHRSVVEGKQSWPASHFGEQSVPSLLFCCDQQTLALSRVKSRGAVSNPFRDGEKTPVAQQRDPLLGLLVSKRSKQRLQNATGLRLWCNKRRAAADARSWFDFKWAFLIEAGTMQSLHLEETSTSSGERAEVSCAESRSRSLSLKLLTELIEFILQGGSSLANMASEKSPGQLCN